MAKATKPPKTYICRFCQYVFKRSEHLARHERSHTQEKPFGCSVCACQFSRKDLVVRHERMIHFERKSTTRITARKARKYEPRRQSESASSESKDLEATPPSTATTAATTPPTTTTTEPVPDRRHSIQIPEPESLPNVAGKALADAISASSVASRPTPTFNFSATPEPIIRPRKRRATDGEISLRPTKLPLLETISPPMVIGRKDGAPMAPVPMFGPLSAFQHEPLRLPDTSSLLSGYAIDPLLQAPAYDPQLEKAAEENMNLFTHNDHQLVSPPLSLNGDAIEDAPDRETEILLKEAAATIWKPQAEAAAKASS